MTDVKAFPVADILGALTGLPVGSPLAVLGWMTGERPGPWGHANASRRCRARLCEDHADLAAVKPPPRIDEQALAAWVADMTERFGPTREIARLGAVPEQRSYAA